MQAQLHVSDTVACFDIMADTSSHVELMMMQERLVASPKLKQSFYYARWLANENLHYTQCLLPANVVTN